MNKYLAELVTVASVSPEYPHYLPDGNVEWRVTIEVTGIRQEGKEYAELTVSNRIYHLNKLWRYVDYMVIYDEEYNVQFIEELYSFYRREAFSKSFFHNIRTAIFELEHSLKFCSGKDEKLIQNTIDNLLYTLIAIGREANKEMDSEFFEDYNSSRDSLCLMEKNEE